MISESDLEQYCREVVEEARHASTPEERRAVLLRLVERVDLATPFVNVRFRLLGLPPKAETNWNDREVVVDTAIRLVPKLDVTRSSPVSRSMKSATCKSPPKASNSINLVCEAPQ
jgi:hypothetical protein